MILAVGAPPLVSQLAIVIVGAAVILALELVIDETTANGAFVEAEGTPCATTVPMAVTDKSPTLLAGQTSCTASIRPAPIAAAGAAWSCSVRST